MFGIIYPNKTGNGILGNLVERRADVGFGGLSSWHGPYKYLAYSKPIQRDSVTCLTPKPMYEYNSSSTYMESDAHCFLTSGVDHNRCDFLHYCIDASFDG